MPALLVEPVPTPAPATPAWRLHSLDETDSTNRGAARLGPWRVLTSRIQTAGRGRHARRWVSDDGGLWMSAVLPTPGPLPRWGFLPLAAGWAVCRALSGFGLADLRLRWPNDVMTGPAKLAGILVERFSDDTAVVGIGVNCDNRPEQADAALAGTVARLCDLAHPAPTRAAVRDAILRHLAEAQALLASDRSAELAARLEPFWQHRPVRATLRTGGTVEGVFRGVDATGQLHLQPAAGAPLWLAPVEVELLRELS